ncbi:UFD1-domain-containing protein [Trichocladium antarcticum]|uniref:UFD1-domain-containing protein n=1 Tax=Trichocladium antarcticum TaxID=1450529 RepID=A0AAN6UHW2_9PEZI|nr:UFD1-domain-containing protein [Trichocladium antarcticum]
MEPMFNSWASGGADQYRSLRTPRNQRFDEYYRCYPLIMAPGAERPELNYGSKILLPPSALDKVSRMRVQWPIMLELNNGAQGKRTHAGVLEFVAEEGRAYIPQWMMQTLHLEVGDMIQVNTTSLELAKLVKLQPQSVNFLDITDPRAVLEKAFRNFAALTKGDVFNFEYNDEIYDMAVLDVKPETDKMGVSMIETDVSVDFAPPVGYVEPERVPRGSGTSTPGSASILPRGGLLHSQGTMAQAINYDSIAPDAVGSLAGNFYGEGQRLSSKKGNKASTPKPATPVAGTSSGAKEAAVLARRNNGPAPLRLPPNKLFLGYKIKPVKTDEDKEREAANAKQPHFAGQGQTLRAAVKRKGEEGDGKSDR